MVSRSPTLGLALARWEWIVSRRDLALCLAVGWMWMLGAIWAGYDWGLNVARHPLKYSVIPTWAWWAFIAAPMLVLIVAMEIRRLVRRASA